MTQRGGTPLDFGIDMDNDDVDGKMSPGEALSIPSENEIDMDDGCRKMSPREAVTGTLLEEAKQCYTHIFDNVMTDIEETFTSHPKYKEMNSDQQQILRDLVP